MTIGILQLVNFKLILYQICVYYINGQYILYGKYDNLFCIQLLESTPKNKLTKKSFFNSNCYNIYNENKYYVWVSTGNNYSSLVSIDIFF